MRVVVAAIVERDGKVLVCRRRDDQSHPGKWEFPGGKVEPDESFEIALARELREELAIEATVGEEITRYHYAYPDQAPILLVFYQVRDFAGQPRNLAFAEIAWEKKERLPAYDFLGGDVHFVRKLAGAS